MANLPDQALEQVANYFRALAEPTRLKILNQLRSGEQNVGDLAQACHCTVANASKHLSLLAKHGLVSKRNRGTHAFYQIDDPTIYELCDLVCGNIVRQLDKQTEFAALMRAASASSKT